MKREEICNFAAGPSMLPTPVLNKIQTELLNYHETGMSVMELSHRSKIFEEIIETTKNNLRKLLNIPINYEILFMQGVVPLNLVPFR